MFQQSIINRSKTIYQSLNNPVTIVQQLFNSHLKPFNNRLIIASESFENRVKIVKQWFNNRSTTVLQYFKNR